MASPAINKTNPELLAAKLGALIRDLGIDTEAKPAGGGGGAALSLDGTAYVLHAPEFGVRALGPALLWITQQDLTKLVLFSDDHGADLARRAALVTHAEVSVRTVTEATSEPAGVAQLLPAPALSEQVMSFAPTMAAAGVTPVDDFGRLVGEVFGLEVVRVTIHEDGDPYVEVGVGQADRELHELVHSNLEVPEAIARASAMVAEHRAKGAAPHPLNRLGRARWLRSVVVQDPSLVGFDGTLEPTPPLRARDTVLGSEPAAAVGDGIVVVATAGIDPDLVPEALEYRQRHNSEAELVLVMVATDRLATTDRLISQCANTRVVALEPPWTN